MISPSKDENIQHGGVVRFIVLEKDREEVNKLLIKLKLLSVPGYFELVYTSLESKK